MPLQIYYGAAKYGTDQQSCVSDKFLFFMFFLFFNLRPYRIFSLFSFPELLQL